MQNVHRLRAIRFLTEQQVVTALAFYQNPNRFRLAPTLFGVLHEIIIQGEPLEKIEERRGWPARSAKAILSILLHSLEETRGAFWSDAEVNPDVEEMKARSITSPGITSPTKPRSCNGSDAPRAKPSCS